MSVYPENPSVGQISNNRQWDGTAWVALDNPLSVQYVTKTGGSIIESASANTVPITLKGASGQTEPLLKLADSNDVVVTQVNPSGSITFQSETSAGSVISTKYSDDTTSRSIQFAKYRGSIQSPAVVQENDNLGLIRYYGYSPSGNGVLEAARIQVDVDGEPDTAGDTSDMPGRITFRTTPNGSSSPTERMRINNAGAVMIGTTSPGSAGAGDLVVNGGVFLGGTASANELSDYEEGTWTPEYTFGTSGSVTHDIQSGDYMRINNKVFIWARLRTDAVSSPTGSVRVSGLPFNTSATISLNYGMGGVVTYAASFGGDRPSCVSVDTASVDYVNLRFRSYVNGETNQLQGSDMGTAANNNDLEFNAWYWAS